jgi:hypothetical protein
MQAVPPRLNCEIDYAESEKDNWLERYDAECKGAPGANKNLLSRTSGQHVCCVT